MTALTKVEWTHTVNFIIFCKVFYVKSKFKDSKIKYVPSGSKYGNEMLTLAPSVEETSLFFLAPENNLCFKYYSIISTHYYHRTYRLL